MLVVEGSIPNEKIKKDENMPQEQFMKLHGVLRGLTPTSEVTR